MSLSPGTRLGPYEIVGLAGSGGMGEVYRARDTRLDRSVAIKVLPHGMAADPDLRQRFEREAKAIAALNHPHICVLYDVGETPDRVSYLVMEDIAGETLSERLKKGPLALEQVLTYGIELADALDKAHRQGITHRDLKPGNVMITKTGTKLLDFGLAKLRSDAPAQPGISSQAPTADADLTVPGSILGTLQYMSPEQLEGREADARSDIFALGVVLYEMATGTRAFEGKSRATLMAAILERTPRPVSQIQPRIPAALEHLIEGCLAKDPDDRWQTAHDVMKQLKWIVANGSRVETLAGSPSRRGRMGRMGWIVAAAFALVIAAGVVAVLRYLPAADNQATRFEVTTADMPNPNYLSISPDGRRIAFVAGSSVTAAPIYVRSVDSIEAQSLPGTEGASFPFWSPDSRHIGFAAGGKLRRIDIAGGPPQSVADISLNFGGGSWNADNIIVFASGPSTGNIVIMRVAASGGEPVAVTQLDKSKQEISHYSPLFLPGGRRFLYTAWSAVVPENRAIYAGSLDSPERTLILKAASMPLYSPSGFLLYHRDGTLMAQAFDAGRLTLKGEPIRVADSLAFNPGTGRAAVAVSDSGTLVYRQGTAFERSQLNWYDRNGKPLGALREAGVYRGVALSPDNTNAAVHLHEEPGGGDIWVQDLKRGTFTKLTFNAHNFAPAWSQDGSHIYFTSDRDGLATIYRMASSGAGAVERILTQQGFFEDEAPDGRLLLFGGAGKGIDVWSLPLTGERKPKAVVSSDFFDGFSKFSPNGRWIAYESDESGSRQVYVQPFPEPSGKWQISTKGGRYVRWSRNGKELFYLTDEGSMMAVDVQPDGPAFKAGTPHALFKTNPVLGNHRGSTLDIPYDVSNDGQRFIINERVGAAQKTPITVLLHWTAAINK